MYPNDKPLHKTLEQIIAMEQRVRTEDGDFGIAACKNSIKFSQEFFGKSLYQQLEEYVNRANEDMFFNKAMVLACWEMINER